MPANPTVFIFLAPDGNLYAEAAGKNGARQKLGAFALRDFPPEIQSSLLGQRDTLRAAELAEQKEIREKVFINTWRHHGRRFAERVIPVMAGKFDPETGKIVRAKKADNRPPRKSLEELLAEL